MLTKRGGIIMTSKQTMGWGAVVLAILVALTEALTWSGSLNYLWAVLVLIWGFMSFK